MIENKGTNEKSQRQPNIKMMWTGSKVALTELLFALHTEGAFNNGAADLKDIAEYFEHIFELIPLPLIKYFFIYPNLIILITVIN